MWPKTFVICQNNLVNISFLNGTLNSHIRERGRLPLHDQGVLDELRRVVQGEVHLGGEHLEPSPRAVKFFISSNSEKQVRDPA